MYLKVPYSENCFADLKEFTALTRTELVARGYFPDLMWSTQKRLHAQYSQSQRPLTSLYIPPGVKPAHIGGKICAIGFHLGLSMIIFLVVVTFA